MPQPKRLLAAAPPGSWLRGGQLHLAYDDGAEPLDFFNRFFAAWKSGQYFNGASAYDDKVALTASVAAYLLLASRREVKVFCFPSLVWMAMA